MTLTGKFKITAINKKTQAKALRGLKVGDVFELRWDLGGCYHSSPQVAVWSKGEYQGSQYASQMTTTFKNHFELEEVQ